MDVVPHAKVVRLEKRAIAEAREAAGLNPRLNTHQAVAAPPNTANGELGVSSPIVKVLHA